MRIIPKIKGETLAEYTRRVREDAKQRARLAKLEVRRPPDDDDGPDDLCEAALKIMRGERG